MSDEKCLQEQIDALARENAQLNGLALATGVILTQLLQSICRRELNPQGAATKIMNNAREAIDGFRPEVASRLDPVMKQRALVAVDQYEQQIRSVLRE
jgi:hypothetical protein